MTDDLDLLDGHFHDLLLHFVVQIDAVFRAPDVVGKVVPAQVLLEVVQPVEEVGRLPGEVLDGQPGVDPLRVVVLQRALQVGRQLGRVDGLRQSLQIDGVDLEKSDKVRSVLIVRVSL